MATQLEELWNDLALADSFGDEELARQIYSLIEEEESRLAEEKPGVLRGIAAAGASSIARGVAGALDSPDELARMANPLTAGLEIGSDIARKITGTEEPAPAEQEKPDWLQGTIDVARDIGQAESEVFAAARPEGFGAGLAYDATGALAQMLPSVLTTLVTRSPNLGLTMMAIPAYGTAYEEALAEGKTQDEAVNAGVLNAMFEVGPEKLFGVFERIAGDKSVRDVFETMAREAFSEITTEELNAGYDVLTGKDVGDTGDLLARFGYSGLVGSLLGGGMTLPGVPGNRARAQAEEEALAAEAVDQASLQAGLTSQPVPQVQVEPEPEVAPAEAAPIEEEPLPQGFSYEGDLGLQAQGQEMLAPSFLEYDPQGFTTAELESGTYSAIPEGPITQGIARDTFSSDFEQGVDVDPGATVWDPAMKAAVNLPEAAQMHWGDFVNQMEYFRQQEQQMLEAAGRVPALPSPEFSFGMDLTPQELALAESPSEPIVPSVEGNPLLAEAIEQDAAARRTYEQDKATQLQQEMEALRARAQAQNEQEREVARTTQSELDERAEEWAILARPENVKYSRGSEKSQWRVTGFQPKTGRVFAEWESDNGKIAVTWTLDEGTPRPHKIYEDPVTGQPTNRIVNEGARLDKSGEKIPTAFKKQVDRIYREAVKYGDPNMTVSEALAANKSGKAIFAGARPLEAVLDEELRKVRKNNRTAKNLAALEEETRKEVSGLQARTVQIVKESIKSEKVDLAGDTVTKSVGEVWKDAPVLEEDTTAKVVTIIDPAAKKRLKNGTALQERAYQVLPDGGIRILNIQPRESRRGYDIVAVSIDGRSLINPTKVGSISAKLSPKVKEALKALPGNTVALKLERQRRKVLDAQRKEEARKEAATKAVPAYKEKGTKPSKATNLGGPSADTVRPEDAEVLRKNLLSVLNRLDGKAPTAADVGARVSAQRKYAHKHKQLMRIVEPVLESDAIYRMSAFAKEGTLRAAAENTSADFNSALTMRGLAQQRHAEQFINRLLQYDFTNEELIDLTARYSDWVRENNPDFGTREDFDLKSLPDLYKSAELDSLQGPEKDTRRTVAGERKYRKDLEDAFRKKIAENYRVSEDTADAIIKATGLMDPELASRKNLGSSVVTPTVLKPENVPAVKVTRKQPAGPAAPPRTPKEVRAAELERKRVLKEQGKVAGNKRRAEQPGREIRSPELTALGKEIESLRAESTASGERLRQTVESIRKEVSSELQRLSERAQGRKRQRQRLLADVMAGRPVSEAGRKALGLTEKDIETLFYEGVIEETPEPESVYVASTFEEAKRGKYGPEIGDVQLARDIDPTFRGERTFMDVLRDDAELARIEGEEAAAEVDKAKPAATPKTPQETLLIVTESLAETKANAAELKKKGRRIAKLLKKHPVGKEMLGFGGVTPGSENWLTGFSLKYNEQKLANEVFWGGPLADPAIEEAIGDYIIKDAYNLTQTEDWRKAVAPKSPEAPRTEDPPAPPNLNPTPVQVERAARTVDLDSSDPVAQSTFETNMVVQSWPKWMDKYAWLRNAYVKGQKYVIPSRYAGTYQLHDLFTKEGRAKRKDTRTIIDSMVRLKGAVRNEILGAKHEWVNARAVLREAGWKREDQNWERALNAYLEGTSQAAAEAEWGVKIPPKAIEHLDRFIGHRDELARIGLVTGAWDRASVRGAILGGRAYLHHSVAKDDSGFGDVLDSHMAQMIELFKQSSGIPQSAAEIDQMTVKQLLRVLNDKTHEIWSTHVKDSTADTADKAKNIKTFEIGGLSVMLGKPAANGRITEKALYAEADKFKDAASKEAVKNAKLRALREAMKLALPKNDAVYAAAITGMVNKLREAPPVRGSRGYGANTSIVRKRELLLSERDMVRDSLKYIRAGIKDKELRKDFSVAIKASGATWEKMTLNQFLATMERQFPHAEAGINRARAVSKFNYALRATLNEVTDTETLAYDTIESVADSVFTAQYLGTIVRQGLNSGWASIGVTRQPGKGWVPLAPAGTALGDASFHIPGRIDSFHKGSEVRVPPHIASIIASNFGIDVGVGKDRWSANLGARALSSWTKKMKVVWNPLSHPRNWVSTRMLHWAANAVGLGKGRATKVGSELSRKQWQAAISEKQEEKALASISQEARTLMGWMAKRGMLFDGGRAGALSDLQQFRTGSIESSAFVAATGRIRGTIEQALKRVDTVAGESFRLEDESVKGPALLTQAAEYLTLTGQNESLLDKGLAGQKLSPSEEAALNKALDWAAEVVLNTYPTFSRTAPLIKAASRNTLIGAFPSFPYEVARTSINSVLYAASLIEGSMTGTMRDGTKIAPSQRATAFALGMGKLATRAALWSSASVGGQALAAMVKESLGWGDDDDESQLRDNWLTRIGESQYSKKVRSLLPWYARDTMATISDVDTDTGEYTMMVLDYVSPTGVWENQAMKMAQRILDAAETGNETLMQAAINGAWDGVEQIFLQDEVLFGGFIQRVKKGDRLWTSKDDRALKKAADYLQERLGSWPGAMAATAVEQLTPSELITQLFDFADYAKESVDLINDPAAENMVEHFLGGILHVGGLKQKRMSFEKDWVNSFKQEERQMGTSTTVMRERLATGPGRYKNYEEFKAAFDELNHTRREHFDTMYSAVQAARSVLHRDNAQINAAVGEAGIKEMAGGHPIEHFATGKYYPPTIGSFRDVLVKYIPGGDNDDSNDAFESEEEALQRLQWYYQALTDEGTETSVY